jgi:hypothetical protein
MHRNLVWTVAAGLFALSAGAEPVTYVSADGRDTAPCTRRQPCRTFAQALGVTDVGGSVVALDSGVFSSDALSIDQSVTLAAAPGVRAELTAPTAGALFVNAPGSVVVLRGLTFTGQPTTPNNGIVYNTALALHVENCDVSGFPTKGILSLSLGQLFVKDSVFRGSFVGVSLDARTRATFDGVRFENNQFGLNASLGSRATVRNSSAAGNTQVGFLAGGLAGFLGELSLEDCTAANNAVGVAARDGATVRVSNCMVTDNTTGLQQSGASVLESRGNNTVRGNTTDVSGTLTPIAGS